MGCVCLEGTMRAREWRPAWLEVAETGQAEQDIT